MKGNYCFLVALCLLLSPAVASAKTLRRKPLAKKIAQSTTDTSSPFYTVKKGDTLLRVARTQGTTVSAIKNINSLRTSNLKVGQKLRLSVASTKPSEASVKKVTLESVTLQHPKVAELEKAEVLAGPVRLQLAKAGLDFIGTRYRIQGESPKTGFDCSGFVKTVFRKFNIDLPRSSREQYRVGEKVGKDELQAGDLVFFSGGGKTPNHVGIYLGDNLFVHAARKARQVIVSSLDKNWYVQRFLGGRRLSELWGDELKEAEQQTN
jgi:peptidoglycan DL-endopeptidase LytE